MLPANGVATATLTVTLRYTTGQVIAGEPVALRLLSGSTSGTFINGQAANGLIDIGQSDANGQVTAIISATTAETKTLEAYAGIVRLLDQAEIGFDADVVDGAGSTLAVSGPSTVAADGQATVAVVVTARDRFGNLVPNINATLHTTPSVTAVPATATTDSNGQAQFQLSHNTPTQTVISATLAGEAVAHMVDVTFLGPDLSVSKLGPTEVISGHTTTQTVFVENVGLLAAQNVVITDTLPAAYSFTLQNNLAGATFNQAGQTLTWHLAELTPNELFSVTLVLTPSHTLNEGDIVTTTVAASNDNTDLNQVNNLDYLEQVIRLPVPQLNLDVGFLEANLSPSTPNQTATLTIVNTGQAPLTGLVVNTPTVMPWVTLSDAAPTDIAVGQSVPVVFNINPPSTVPAGIYRDYIVVNDQSGQEQRAILRVNIDLPRRDLQVNVQNTAGHPVSNALVQLRLTDALVDVTPAFTNTLNLYEEGYTDERGVLTITNIAIGHYDLAQVFAPDHIDRIDNLTLPTGSNTFSYTTVLTAQGDLQVSPNALYLGVAAGQSDSQDLVIRNNGADTIHNLSVTTPSNLDWLTLARPVNWDQPLAAGDALTFTLYANPSSNQASQTYLQTIQIGAATTGKVLSKDVNLQIAVTDAVTGNLAVEVTRAISGTPVLEAATVTLVRQVPSTQTVGTKVVTYYERYVQKTAEDGVTAFIDLPMGAYNYLIEKEGYEEQRGVVEIHPQSQNQASRSFGLASLLIPHWQGNTGHVTVSLKDAPFTYDWEIIATEEGYDIELIIRQNDAAEGVSLVAPTRNWNYVCSDLDLTDNVPILNPTSTDIVLDEASISVPGVDVALQTTFPFTIPAGDQGAVSLQAQLRDSNSLAQGTINLKGSYYEIDDDRVSFNLNPSSLSDIGLQPSQMVTKSFTLTPINVEAGQSYDLSFGQSALYDEWLTISGPSSVSAEGTVNIDLTLTPPDWFVSNVTYTDMLSITLKDRDSDAPATVGFLSIEITRIGETVSLHTSFRLAPSSQVKQQFSTTGAINVSIDDNVCDGDGDTQESHAEEDVWRRRSGGNGGGFSNSRSVKRDDPINEGTLGAQSTASGDPAEATGDGSQEITISLSNGLVLDGEGLQADLTLNSIVNETVTNIAVTMLVTDSSGNNATNQFVFLPTSPTALVDLTPAGGVSESWLIIPDLDIIDPVGSDFSIAALVDYTYQGSNYRFLTRPENFTVFPSPELMITYALPANARDGAVCDVFSLQATVHNQGAGPARSVSLNAGQARIIEATGNTSQSFTVQEAYANGDQVSDVSMSLPLGTIGPGESATAHWVMKAENPGKFIEFSSDFTMQNYIGQALRPAIREIVTEFTGPECEEIVTGPTPSPPIVSSGTYTLTGRVTDAANGTGLSNVTLTMGTLNTTTDSTGDYQFTDVAEGTYTVTPSASGYHFTAASVSLNADRVQDFSGEPGATYNISGQITNVSGNPMPGVAVMADGQYQTISDGNGAYTLANVVPATYTVYPSLTGTGFIPPEIIVDLNSGDIAAIDFQASSAPATYAIQGTIANADGVLLANVRVVLSTGVETTTNAQGFYRFASLTNKKTYVVTPDGLGSGYIFSPNSRAIYLNGYDQTVNFQEYGAAGSTPTYTINGHITGETGQPLQGAIITLNGDQQVSTDSAGGYIFGNLAAGVYRLVASAPGFGFTPKSVSVPPDGDQVDFQGQPMATYNILGQVKDEGDTPLANVTITTDTGFKATTDNNGAYVLTDLPAGDYVLLPIQDEYTFSPATQNVTLSGTNEEGVDFTAQVADGSTTYLVSGFVTDEAGQGLVGVTVFAGGATTTTDAQGYYHIPNLSSGPVQIAPSQEGYHFTPATHFVALPPSQVGLNFVATEGDTYSVSGHVVDDGGQPLPDVTVQSHLGPTALTAANGDYTLSGLAADQYHQIVAQKDGYMFEPFNHTVLVDGHRIDRDFVGQPPNGALTPDLVAVLGDYSQLNPQPGTSIKPIVMVQNRGQAMLTKTDVTIRFEYLHLVVVSDEPRISECQPIFPARDQIAPLQLAFGEYVMIEDTPFIIPSYGDYMIQVTVDPAE